MPALRARRYQGGEQEAGEPDDEAEEHDSAAEEPDDADDAHEQQWNHLRPSSTPMQNSQVPE